LRRISCWRLVWRGAWGDEEGIEASRHQAEKNKKKRRGKHPQITQSTQISNVEIIGWKRGREEGIGTRMNANRKKNKRKNKAKRIHPQITQIEADYLRGF